MISVSAQTLLAELPRLTELGVDVLRISPQSQHTLKIIAVFDRCCRGELPLAEGERLLVSCMPVGPCDGYWHGQAGLAQAVM